MAFNAGSIEATLTLNRTPFTAGLRLARQEAENWAKNEIKVNVVPKLQNTALRAIKQRIESVTSSIDVKLRLRNTELQAIRARLASVAGRIDVRLNLVSGEIAALQARLRGINAPMVRVRLGIADGEIAALRARIAAIDAEIRVGLNLSAAEIAAIIARIRAIRATVDIDLDIRSGAAHGFGNQMRAIFASLPALVPMAASAITGLIGLVGGLVSALGVAAAGFGALALVAVPTFTKISDAVKAGQAEIDKLPPGLREAGNALKSLQETYDKLVKATETPVGFMMEAGFKAAEAALGPLEPLIVKAAEAVTSIGKQMEQYFNSDHYKDFVSFLTDNVGPAFQKIFEIVAYLTRAVMNLIVAFDPLADWLLEAMAQGMKDFAEWTSKLANDPKFQEWLELVKKSLEAVWNWIVELTKFIVALSTALAPFGNLLFDLFAGLFEALSSMPPEMLAGIAEGLFAIMAALLLGASGPVALVIGVIAAVAAGLAYLYETNEKVRATIDGIVQDLKDRFLPIWESIQKNIQQYVIPAWNALVEAFEKHVLPVLKDIWNYLLANVVPAIQSLADTITQKVIPAILDFFTKTAPFWAWLIDVVGKGVVDAFTALIQAVDGAFIIIAGLFETFAGLFTADWETFWQGLNDIAEGFWTIIAAAFGMTFEELKETVRLWAIDLENMWNGFWGGVITDQQGHQTVVAGAWNDFWTASAQNFQDQLVTPVTNAWAAFWGGIITQQDGSQTQVAGAWNDFWAATAQNFQTQIAGPVSKAWDTLWGEIKGAFSRFGSAISQEWKSFWDGVSQYFTRVGDNIKKFWETTLQSLKTITETVTQAIGTAFRKVGNFFREPINWVIRVVINDGILNAWNTVMGWIGAPALAAGRVPEIPAFASGGQIRGKGTGTSDSILAKVSNGEFIVRAAVAEKIGGFLNALNSGSTGAMMIAGASSNSRSPVPGFALGGIIETAKSWWETLSSPIASLFRGIPSTVPGGGVIGQALSKSIPALLNKVIEALKNKLSELIVPTQTFGPGGNSQVMAPGPLNRPPAPTGTGVFDNGGFLMPGPLNGTGKPEPVLTGRQWDAVMENKSPDVVRKLDQVIEVLERIGMRAFVSKSSSDAGIDYSDSDRRTLLNLRLPPRG